MRKIMRLTLLILMGLALSGCGIVSLGTAGHIRHGGSIDVESTLGAGSTVTLRFPRIPLQRLGEPGAHDAFV